MEKYLILSRGARGFLFSLVVLFSFLAPAPSFAEPAPINNEAVASLSQQDSESPLKVEFVSFSDQIAEGKPFWIGIRLEMEKGWKTYWKNPGETGYPLTIDWELPKGFTAEEIIWPTPHKSTLNGIVTYGYDEPVTLLVKINPPSHLSKDESIPLNAKLSWLVCNDEACLPGEGTLSISYKSGAVQPNNQVELESALDEIPQELTGAKVHQANADGIVLFIPKDSYKKAPMQAQFYPESASLKNDLNLHVEPLEGAFIHLQPYEHGGAIKGVLQLISPDETKSFAVDLPVGSILANTGFAEEASSYGMILVFAFVGGIILNLMPCVLPVVSLKVLSFINMAGQSRRKTMLHGALFSMGVLISFWALAAVILVLRELGHTVGWGFQLQNATFVALLASLLLLLSLWLFGLFEIGFKLSAKTGTVVEKAKAKQQKESAKMWGSFLSGVLATAVATPCSGPFLGTALGVAMTVPVLESLLIFTSLGLGMASPYIILAAFPKLLKFLPKPGAWMETFKQLMGFLMLFAVVWLIWVFTSQSDSSDLLRLLIGFVVLAFAGWIYGKTAMSLRKAFSKVVLLGVAILSFTGGFYLVVDAGNRSMLATNTPGVSVEKGWEAFSTETIDKLRQEGKGVFIDFTAKWCLLCQANLIILQMPSVEQKMEELGVVKMMADWTKADPRITAELARFGRNSVPLYIYYPPGKNSKPQVLPQVLTQDVVLDTLE